MQLASGGTLFLDEVGEIPLEQQGKLLRALQENEFERVGDEKTIKVDVRVVAATNRELQREVEKGNFRQDLYYRLSVFPIEVPPLRKRSEDIVPLTLHFLQIICRELGKETLQLTRQHGDSLLRHAWPGNVRELKNVVERAVILSERDYLRLDLAMPQMDADVSLVPRGVLPERGFMTEVEMRERQKQNLRALLDATNWRVSGPAGAAERMGVKPSTLAYRMKIFGLEKPRPGSVSM